MRQVWDAKDWRSMAHEDRMRSAVSKAAIPLICLGLLGIAGCTPKAFNTLAPLYRILNETHSVDHCVTASTLEKNQAVAIHGYVDEGIMGFVYSIQQPGTFALKRYYKRTSTYHDHDLRLGDFSADPTSQGYKYEGIIGYAYGIQVPWTKPLYRLYKSSPYYDHLFTMDEAERSMAIHELGYVDDGVVAYVWPVGFTPYHQHGVPRNYDGEVIFVGNDKMTVGVDTRYGGSITYVIDNVTDSARNLVDRNDTGRYIQLALYDHPPKNTTYNPVQGGDTCNNPTGSIAFSSAGSEIYVRSNPLHWSYYGSCLKKSDVTFETWVSVPGDYVRVRHAITYYGSGPLGSTNRQEMPAVYAIEALSRQLIYDGTDPWCNKPPTEHHQTHWHKTFTPTEGWSALADSNGVGILVYNPQVPGDPIQNTVRTVFTDFGANPAPTHFMASLRSFGFGASGDKVEFEVLLIPGDVIRARQTIYDLFKPDVVHCPDE